MNDSESKISHGFLWLGTASAAVRVLDLLTSVVVLWLLSSEQMGLASLSWTVAIVVEAFNGLGVGVALVQADRVDDEELDSLYWFTLGFGALFTGAIVLASPVIAGAFGAPGLAPMVSVAALRLLFMAAALVPLQMLQRRLEFRQIAAVQTLAAGLAALAKVGLAAAGFGAWALVIGHTSEALFTLLTVYALSPFWPKLRFSVAKVARFVRFGLKAAASTVVYQSYRNLDFVIVGRAFGVSALGVYRVAFDAAMVPMMAILEVVNRTAFPIYSRIGVSEPERLKRVFLWMIRVQALLAGPLAVLLYFFGVDLLATIAGNNWLAAGPIIQVLCWAGMLRVLTQSVPQLFHAAGRPELAVYDSLLTLPCFLACGWGLVWWLGAAWGANAVALAWIATYLIMLSVLRFMARSLIGLTASEYLKNLLHPLLLMGAMFASLWLTMPTLRSALPGPFSVALGIALGLSVMLVYCRFVLKLRVAQLWPRGAATDVEAQLGRTDAAIVEEKTP